MSKTGESYIGTFNSMALTEIDEIKGTATALIDLIQNLESPDARRKEIACTQIELGTMMAVKALFSDK